MCFTSRPPNSPPSISSPPTFVSFFKNPSSPVCAASTFLAVRHPTEAWLLTKAKLKTSPSCRQLPVASQLEWNFMSHPFPCWELVWLEFAWGLCVLSQSGGFICATVLQYLNNTKEYGFLVFISPPLTPKVFPPSLLQVPEPWGRRRM